MKLPMPFTISKPNFNLEWHNLKLIFYENFRIKSNGKFARRKIDQM
jgi:hypothetical protein